MEISPELYCGRGLRAIGSDVPPERVLSHSLNMRNSLMAAQRFPAQALTFRLRSRASVRLDIRWVDRAAPFFILLLIIFRRMRDSRQICAPCFSPDVRLTRCAGLREVTAHAGGMQLILPLRNILILPSAVKYLPLFRPSRCRNSFQVIRGGRYE
jgi:hypothetical protein